MRIMQKWEKIDLEIGKRQHAQTIKKISQTNTKDSQNTLPNRAATRIYGTYGVYNDLLRREYQAGLAKLNSNSFATKEDKEEWQNFVETLEPHELQLVQDKEWT